MSIAVCGTLDPQSIEYKCCIVSVCHGLMLNSKGLARETCGALVSERGWVSVWKGVCEAQIKE